MAIRKPFTNRRYDPRQADEVDPRMKTTRKPTETPLPYGRKATEQGDEGVDITPGTYDRDAMYPDDEDAEYPRQRGRNFAVGHRRSLENTISMKTKARDLASKLKF